MNLNELEIYLGKHNTGGSSGQELDMEPMVLGNQLLSVLRDLIALLKDTHVIVQGAPMKPSITPTVPPTKFLGNELGDLESKLNEIVSKYHYIEPNTGAKK